MSPVETTILFNILIYTRSFYCIYSIIAGNASLLLIWWMYFGRFVSSTDWTMQQIYYSMCAAVYVYFDIIPYPFV